MPRRAPLLIVTMVVALSGIACAPVSTSQPQAQWGAVGGDAWMTKRDTVAVGAQPPLADEAGVAGIDPGAPAGTLPMTTDLAEFGTRWNEAAPQVGSAGLSLSSFTLVYNQPFLAFGTPIAGQDWHTLVGGIDYGTGAMLYADIEFAPLQFEQRPGDVYQTWVDSLACFVFASAPEITIEDASALVSELALAADAADAEGSAAVIAHGLEFTFTVDELSENLRVTGAGGPE